jgi:UDP-N-acetylmuramoyl-L-alanyl-D-glutamate--2,6-diaminopimelate ligase
MALSGDGSRFRCRTPWGDTDVRIGLLGRHNVSNALAAIAAAGVFGVDVRAAAATLGRMACVPGRLEEIPTRRGFQVFVDYAHTDDALRHVLSTLRELARGRVIVVFGCGGDRDTRKRPLMGAVAAELADLAILTSDNPRSEDPATIIAAIERGFGDRSRYEIVENRAEAISRALRLARSGDIVLVAGKGHENFQELANKVVPFDDRAKIRECLG